MSETRKLVPWEDLEKNLHLVNKHDDKIIDILTDLMAERINSGVSVVKFAKKIGMKPSQLSKIEAFDSIPTFATLNRYANGLGHELEIRIV